MLHFALDRLDAGGIESGVHPLVPDRLRRRFGNDAEFGHCFGGMGFDLEPDAEAGLWLPDGSHFKSGIARNHRA